MLPWLPWSGSMFAFGSFANPNGSQLFHGSPAAKRCRSYPSTNPRGSSLVNIRRGVAYRRCRISSQPVVGSRRADFQANGLPRLLRQLGVSALSQVVVSVTVGVQAERAGTGPGPSDALTVVVAFSINRYLASICNQNTS